MREGRFCAILFQAVRNSLILKRRDVRVVEGARLESVCRGNSTEGSNPSLSAKFRSASFGGARRLLGHRAIRFAHRDLARIPLSPPNFAPLHLAERDGF